MFINKWMVKQPMDHAYHETLPTEIRNELFTHRHTYVHTHTHTHVRTHIHTHVHIHTQPWVLVTVTLTCCVALGKSFAVSGSH